MKSKVFNLTLCALFGLAMVSCNKQAKQITIQEALETAEQLDGQEVIVEGYIESICPCEKSEGKVARLVAELPAVPQEVAPADSAQVENADAQVANADSAQAQPKCCPKTCCKNALCIVAQQPIDQTLVGKKVSIKGTIKLCDKCCEGEKPCQADANADNAQADNANNANANAEAQADNANNANANAEAQADNANANADANAQAQQPCEAQQPCKKVFIEVTEIQEVADQPTAE